MTVSKVGCGNVDEVLIGRIWLRYIPSVPHSGQQRDRNSSGKTYGAPVYYEARALVGIWQFDIRALSALIVRGVEPGITWTCSGVYKAHILVIVSLRVCTGPQQTCSFSSELTTKRKFQQHCAYLWIRDHIERA